jgi:hypothetical protein
MAVMSESTAPERRQTPDRRRGDRRGGQGRRATDLPPQSGFTIGAAFWAVVGALVVLYLFFLALGAVDPDSAPVATLVALGLAVAWLAHSWQRLWRGSSSPHTDRERRGF